MQGRNSAGELFTGIHSSCNCKEPMITLNLQSVLHANDQVDPSGPHKKEQHVAIARGSENASLRDRILYLGSEAGRSIQVKAPKTARDQRNRCFVKPVMILDE